MVIAGLAVFYLSLELACPSGGLSSWSGIGSCATSNLGLIVILVIFGGIGVLPIVPFPGGLRFSQDRRSPSIEAMEYDAPTQTAFASRDALYGAQFNQRRPPEL